MTSTALRVIDRRAPSPAERARQAQATAESHALEAIQEALGALETAKGLLDGLGGLPVKPGILQAAERLSRAIVVDVNQITSLVGRS